MLRPPAVPAAQQWALIGDWVRDFWDRKGHGLLGSGWLCGLRWGGDLSIMRWSRPPSMGASRCQQRSPGRAGQEIQPSLEGFPGKRKGRAFWPQGTYRYTAVHLSVCLSAYHFLCPDFL